MCSSGLLKNGFVLVWAAIVASVVDAVVGSGIVNVVVGFFVVEVVGMFGCSTAVLGF